MSRPAMNDEQILEKHTSPEPNTGCWLWTGSLNSWGYGRLGKNRRERQAHRLSYTVYVGPIPPDLSVLHSCDVPCCINPRHLFLGTQYDNMRDCSRKGRIFLARGEQQRVSKLTRAAVHEIRTSKERISVLARRFGVSWKAIRLAKDGVTWA